MQTFMPFGDQVSGSSAPPPSPPGSSRRAGDLRPPAVVPQKRRPAPRPATTYPRKRATQACLTCRFRRTKCDNARPACASCVRLGAECTYSEADASTLDPASLSILRRIDELEASIPAKIAQLLSSTVVTASSATPSPSSAVVVQPPARDDVSSSSSYYWAKWKRPLVSIEAVLRWRPFQERQLRLPRLHPQCRSRSESKAPSDFAAWRLTADVDMPAAESMLRSFFDNVHIFNPILEEDDVRDCMRKVHFNGISWDAESCLVLLIYAHGSISTPLVKNAPDTPPADFRQSSASLWGESYFEAAQKRMGMLLCRSGPVETQCFFLAGVYLMATMRPVEAWKMFTQALASCQELSASQPRSSDDDDAGDKESDASRRTYWTCFKSELELRLELYPSLNVSDLTYPAFFPTPPKGLNAQVEAAWYFYLAEISLRRLKNRMLSHLYRLDASASSEVSPGDVVVDFEEQMETWLHSLPQVLQLDGHHESDKQEHEALRFILNGHFHDCQEVMYWQFVVDAVHGRPLQAGSDAELFFRKGLRVAVDRIRQNRPGFYHRHHGTWLMIRSCARSAFVLLAVAQVPALASYLPPGWEGALVDVASLLRFWKDESTDVAEMLEAIEAIRLHLMP
ncbi:hypothetical protein VTK73DRAFT_5535 [Phialemonium thermophilum]|uniref:Zn(2)-C6 fungal-type domain-containing protein n=1 Tax=Phialemonium thermophilum TaxID=223376 RepID=A0ABR3WMV5_9PEZI